MDYREKHTFGQQEIVLTPEGLVSVRGFLYQTPEGFWVLSQEPDLKSCCKGSKGKVMEQIYLEGGLPIEGSESVVLVSGIFNINPKHNEKGELIQYYSIKEPIIKSQTYDMNFLWASAGVIVIAILFLYWKGVFRKT